jgi:hypothetical protein
MISELIGWVSTALVLIGFIANARGFFKTAMITWIIGDVGWITYDIFIDNYSHLVLSLVIICINLYGIYRIITEKRERNVSGNKL